MSVAVACADAAVVAIIFAVISEFNETANINLCAIILLADFVSCCGSKLIGSLICASDEL